MLQHVVREKRKQESEGEHYTQLYYNADRAATIVEQTSEEQHQDHLQAAAATRLPEILKYQKAH
ncbi:hypothetical protein E2C01_026459 [Portunus trituberculatus]|uniref:Uncharacterized protein n=1 Tax=Portunus trituberculatus TaxID=210409 RepID=A0A5B7EIM2_PORTR|nr:hypothetical protein [Portunus trituberculatus]